MQVSAIDGHRIWSSTYDASLNPLIALEQRLLAPYLEHLHNRRFLDVATGTGRWMEHARSAGAKVAGVDLCHEMLQRANAKPMLTGRLVQCDALCLPLLNDWADLAICSFALGYISDIRSLFLELARVSKFLLVTDLHPSTAQRGWKRSFRSGGTVYDIEHSNHTMAELDCAARSAGLKQAWIQEPRLGERERNVFQMAGKEHLFEEARHAPALLITAWTR